MGLDIESSGISRNLKKLAKDNQKVANKALKAAGEAVAETLKRETPVYSGKDENPTHLKDHIVMSNVKDGEIFIGYDKEVSWRVHFVEMGTIKQRPKAFIQRTEKEMQDEVIDIIQRELRRGLGL